MKLLLFRASIVFGLLVVGIPSKSYAQSNEGTDFWFTFMEHIDVFQSQMFALITSKNNATGTISLPILNWSDTFSIQPGMTFTVALPITAQTLGSEKKQLTGIHVVSDRNISVYLHQFSHFRSEASLVLPTESIGTEYYTMCYEGSIFEAENPVIHPSEFVVVATQDNTEVQITNSDRTQGGKPPGTTETIFLDAGQTYQVRAAEASGDLTGSFVKSDKKVAVFSGNAWTSVPADCLWRDNLVEQMYPLGTWGRQYVAAPAAHFNLNIFRILAADDNTTVDILSSTSETLELDAGEFGQISVGNEGVYFRSSKPVLIAQFLTSDACNGYDYGDPSMLLLNPIEQYRDKVTLFNSRFESITESYINAIIKSEDSLVTYIDGDPMILEPNIIKGLVGENDEFMYLTANVNFGSHTLTSLGCGVIASAYGYGEFESYAYGGGASFNFTSENPIPEGECVEDPIIFSSEVPANQYDITWDLGDGTIANVNRVVHMYDAPGEYFVQLFLANKCLGTIDTFDRVVSISHPADFSSLGDLKVCEGDHVDLPADSSEFFSYYWYGPNGFESIGPNHVIRNIEIDETGYYVVEPSTKGCESGLDSIYIEVQPKPRIGLPRDTFICSEFGRFHNFRFDNRYGYEWHNGSSAPSLDVDRTGWYSASITDPMGCRTIDSMFVFEKCPTKIFIPNTFSPNGDGQNDVFEVRGREIIDYQIQIVDRWGNSVYESKDIDEDWDGTLRGDVLSSQVLVYQISLTAVKPNGEEVDEVLHGTITLVK